VLKINIYHQATTECISLPHKGARGGGNESSVLMPTRCGQPEPALSDTCRRTIDRWCPRLAHMGAHLTPISLQYFSQGTNHDLWSWNEPGGLASLRPAPLREHASFYLGTGITGKASPCLLRSFDDTVPHPWFRLAQGVADRWCSRGKSPSCSPTDERKRHIVVTHAILKPSGRSKSLRSWPGNFRLG
jgi:hypothetical protein